MVIILAVAVLGLAGGQQASAQFEDPRKLLDLLKKKGVTKEDPKKKLPGILSGKKDTAKTAITPKNLPNLPGKGLPGNLTGKTQTGNLPGAKSTVLGKGIDPKNSVNNLNAKGNVGAIGDAKGTIGKAGDLKNAKSTIGNIDPKNAKGNLGNLGKGPLSKTALGKGTDLPKGNALLPKGNTFLPKGNTLFGKSINTRTAFSGPMRAATPVCWYSRLTPRANTRTRSIFRRQYRAFAQPRGSRRPLRWASTWLKSGSVSAAPTTVPSRASAIIAQFSLSTGLRSLA